MIGKVDHIGIAVRDLAAAIAFYQGALGLGAPKVEEVPEQQVRVAVLQAGETRIELLQSTSAEGPVGRFLAKRGEGVHHIAFAVDDIERALADLRRAGAELIDERPRIGAGGRRIAFINPRSAHGVLVELSERSSRPGDIADEEG